MKDLADMIEVGIIAVESRLLLFSRLRIEGFGISDHVLAKGMGHVVGVGVVVVFEFVFGEDFLVFGLFVLVFSARLEQGQ